MKVTTIKDGIVDAKGVTKLVEAIAVKDKNAIEDAKKYLDVPYLVAGGGIEAGWRFQRNNFFIDPVITFESQLGALKKLGQLGGEIMVARLNSTNVIIKAGAQVYPRVSVYGLLGGAVTPLYIKSQESLKPEDKAMTANLGMKGFVWGGGASFALTPRIAILAELRSTHASVGMRDDTTDDEKRTTKNDKMTLSHQRLLVGIEAH